MEKVNAVSISTETMGWVKFFQQLNNLSQSVCQYANQVLAMEDEVSELKPFIDGIFAVEDAIITLMGKSIKGNIEKQQHIKQI